jgi:hypothetical protein
MKRVRRLARLTTAALLSVGVIAAMTATASASAIVTRTLTTTMGGDPIPSDNCGTGIPSGTDTVTYTTVQTPAGGTNIVAATEVVAGRIDWSDGSYSLIGSTDHTTFHVVPAGTTVFSEAHRDFADNYSADASSSRRERSTPPRMSRSRTA